MATGKHHALATTGAAPILGVVMWPIVGPDAALVAMLGCLSGLAITPDLDQDLLQSQWKWVRTVPVLGYVWLGLWDLYARAISHRHIASHLPVLGTLGRCVYMWLMGQVIRWMGAPFRWPPVSVVALFALGLAVSDTLHWLMDGCPMHR